jgi:imidazolonepropionase-like amidohydrolase
MKRIVLLILLALTGLTCSNTKLNNADLAITNVTVIDGSGKAAQTDMMVLIKDDTIISIEKSHSLTQNPGLKIIDGKGKFLIPGLWDMHVHGSADTIFNLLMIANGITSVREMYTSRENFSYYIQWRNKTEENKIVGPHLYIPYATFGQDQKWFGGEIISTPEQAIEFVREAKKMGADFIKIFDMYDKEVILTLYKEAKMEHIPVAGHAPICLDYSEAADAGQRTFEHLYGILISTSTKEDSLRKAALCETKNANNDISAFCHHYFFAQPEEWYSTYDSVKADRLFKHLKETGCFICPTFAVFENMLSILDSSKITDEQKRYVSENCWKYWYDLRGGFTGALTPSDYNSVRKAFKNRFEMVKIMHGYGIPVVAGTDESGGCPKSFSIQGFVLHQELSLLVKAGLTPMEAIESTTSNAALAMNVSGKTGTVAVGKCADLVLLDANPLDDINNTRKINSVIKSGNYYSRSQLDSILSIVEKKVKD